MAHLGFTPAVVLQFWKLVVTYNLTFFSFISEDKAVDLVSYEGSRLQ